MYRHMTCESIKEMRKIKALLIDDIERIASRLGYKQRSDIYVQFKGEKEVDIGRLDWLPNLFRNQPCFFGKSHTLFLTDEGCGRLYRVFIRMPNSEQLAAPFLE